MCQTCIGCGKCTGETQPPLKPGTCPLCGYENGDRVLSCSQCGTVLPLPPGRSIAPENPVSNPERQEIDHVLQTSSDRIG